MVRLVGGYGGWKGLVKKNKVSIFGNNPYLYQNDPGCNTFKQDS